MDLVKAEFTLDPVSFLTKFFKQCNSNEFLSNPSVRNLLEALSGQLRASCFYNILTYIHLPKSLWQVTFGEELYPNIYLEMPQR